MNNAPPPYTIKRKRMVIDSRSRDLVAYPTPAKYEISLFEDLFGVTAVNLIVADVPFPAYLIGENLRSVPFSFTPASSTAGQTLVATALLPVGDYSDAAPADLATALGAAMGEAAVALAGAGAVAPTFLATYVARTDTYAIASDCPFSLLFSGRSTGTPAKVLGFGFADYASDPGALDPETHTVAAPFRRDFRKDRYVVIKLTPNAEVITSVSQALDRTFAVVPVDARQLNINADEDGFEKRWTPPLSRVGRLTVQFLDGDGNLYDFQNQDHRLELMFELVGQRVAV
jgi:hypothetical protein